MKISAFIATSLDGFIARNDGDVEWLGEVEAGGEDFGYYAFIEDVDYLVMGRNTFDKVLTFGEWPYDGRRVVVLTSQPLSIPEALQDSVESMAATPDEVVAALDKRGAQHLYVDGGKTIQGFLDAGLIQRMIVTRIPVVLGEGIPLFGPVQQDIRFEHVVTRSYDCGNVQSEYLVSKSVD